MSLDRKDYKSAIPQLESRLSAIENVGDKSLANFNILQGLLEKEIAERQRLYLKQDTSINTITVKMYYLMCASGVTPTPDTAGWNETMPKIDYSNDDQVLWYMSKTFRNGAVIETSTPQQVQLMDGVFSFINSVSGDAGWTTIDGDTISTGRIRDNVTGDNYFDLDSGEFNFQDANGNYVRQNGNGIQIQGTLSLSSEVGNSTLQGILTDLQNQIDGNITTWFYAYVPTNANVPASDWITAGTENEHLGDLFYDTTTGYAYRWQSDGATPPNYSWLRITDSDVTKALADAAAAQDTADSKRRVFVTTPLIPSVAADGYDVGDLWVGGSNGDIWRCATAKTKEQSFSSTDWVLASKYTNDDVANTKIKDSQRVYYRCKVSGTVPKPTTWITATTNIYNDTVSVGNAGWTTKVPPLAANTNEGTTKYPYLYSCIQTRTSSSATPTCSTVLLDENTTVIDGGQIITNSITAEKIQTDQITIGQSQVTNLTTDLANKADTSDIPTNVSDLTNDSGYQTSGDVNTAIDNAKQIKTNSASGSIATFTGSEYPAVELVSAIKSGSSYTDVSVTVAGKNLLKDERYVSSANAVYIGTSTTAQHYYPVGTTLTLSCSFLNGVHYGAYMRYESDTSNRTIWSPTSATTSATITIAKDEKFSLWFYIGTGLTSSNITNLQLELGSTKTTYEAYKGTTYTTDLGQTVSSGGSLDVLNGVLTVSSVDYQCAPQNIAFSQGTNNVWSTSGNVSLTYAIISADAVEALNNPIDGASKVATSYITQIDKGGIKVHDAGDTSNYAGITSNGMSVYQGGTETSKFGASEIDLGKNNVNAVINLCDNAGQITAKRTGNINYLDLYSIGNQTYNYSHLGLGIQSAGDPDQKSYVSLNGSQYFHGITLHAYGSLGYSEFGVAGNNGAGLRTSEYSSNEAQLSVTCDATSSHVWIGIGSGGTAHGLFSETSGAWIAFSDGENNYTGDDFGPWTTSTSTSTGHYLGWSQHRWRQLYAYSAENVVSDRKHKDVIGDIDFAKDLIMGLEPVEFQWKDSDHKRSHMGFIAQDSAEVAKSIGKDLSFYEAHYQDGSDYHGEKADDKDLSWGMMYSELIAPLVKVVQQQQKEIDELKSIVAELAKEKKC